MGVSIADFEQGNVDWVGISLGQFLFTLFSSIYRQQISLQAAILTKKCYESLLKALKTFFSTLQRGVKKTLADFFRYTICGAMNALLPFAQF